jgi:hypothetical protein
VSPPLDIAPDDLALECAEGYKVLAQEALHALAKANERDRRQRAQITLLRDELRRLRAHLRWMERAA